MTFWMLIAQIVSSVFIILSWNADGCGMVTHSLIAHRGLKYFFHGVDPFYAPLLMQNQGALQTGAPAPDWLYACGSNHNAGEETHWTPFHIAAIKYIRKSYPRPWSQDTQKLVAFLFGMVSHYIADMNWHGLNGVPFGYSMIRAVGTVNYQCAGELCGEAHTVCDTGGEFVAAYQVDLGWFQENRIWEVPEQDLVEIMQTIGYDVTTASLRNCNMLFFIAEVAIKYFGVFIFGSYTEKAPYLVENYIDLPLGGVDDMAIWTTFMWNRFANWLDYGPPATPPRQLMERDLAMPPAQSLVDFMNELSFLKLSPLFTTTQVGRITRVNFTGADLSLSEFVAHVRAMLIKTGTKPGPMLKQALKAASLSALPTMAGTLSGWMDELTQWLSPRAPRAFRTYSHPSTEPIAYFGKSISVGDFDNDGKDDIAIGAPGHGTLGNGQQGQVFIMYGNGKSVALEQGNIFSRFGASTAVVDFNADGVDDLAIASPTFGAWNSTGMTEPDYYHYNGRVDVYFGSAGYGVSTSPSYTINTNKGLMFLGSALSSGDLNGDGYMDLLIGSPFDGTYAPQAGRLHMFISSTFRKAGSTVDVLAANQTMRGVGMGCLFGTQSKVVQTNTNRLLLVGAPGYNTGSDAVGRLYAHVLSPTGQAASTPTFTITGEDQNDMTGANFDYGRPRSSGERLLALASPQAGNGTLNYEAGVVTLFPIDLLEGDYNLSSVDAVTTFVGNQKLSRLGSSMVFGDANGDGLDDLLFSEPLLNTRGNREAGAAFLFKGGSSFPTGTVTSLHRLSTWKAGSGDQGARFGDSVAFANVDGSGVKLVVSAPRTVVNKNEMAGQVVLFDSSL